MATSADYLRLASNASRALADTALDQVSHAVLVVDARHKHFPIILANAAARQAFESPTLVADLIEASLLDLLSLGSAQTAQYAIVGLSDGVPASPLALVWNIGRGQRRATTELKLLPGSQGQRLVMLSLSQAAESTDLAVVVDQMPLDLLILDANLKVSFANAGALRANSATEGATVGASARDLIPTSKIPAEAFAQALKGQRYRNEALGVSGAGHPTRWFDVELRQLRAASGEVGLMVLFGEVGHSHSKDSSERRLLALTEHARDIISIADAEGRLQYVSGGVRNSLGYTSEERHSMYIFEHMHPDDYLDVYTQYQQLVAGKIEGFNKEFRIRHKDGSYRWLESGYVSALDNPLIGGVVINSRDITERKQAEFRLAQREEVFRLAADAVDGVIWEWDIPSGVVHRSRGVQEVLGVAPEDLESSADAWQERVHPRDFQESKRAISLALISGRGWTTTYRIRDARGRYKSILERGLIQRNAAGDPVRAIGCCVDVSEIRRLTDILADTQRTAKIGGWDYNFSTRELTWTEEMFRIFGTTPKEFSVSWDAVLAQCVPESAESLREALIRATSSSWQLNLEIEIKTLQDERLWVRIIGHLETLDGKPFRSYGSVQNIQGQKLAQIALENSTGWLKLSMNMAHMHAWRWDRTNDSFEFNTLQGHNVHMPSVYPSMRIMLAKVHPKDQATVKRAIDRAFAEHIEVREEFRLQGYDGRYRSYASTARPLFDAGDVPQGLVGVLQDITGRRESERRLRQSEELLRSTTTNTADTLFLVDTALRVRFINRSVRGLSIEQIIGSDVAVLLPETARLPVEEKLRRILLTGDTDTYEFESCSDGHIKYFENHAVLVREDGIGTGISISMRDITDRKRLEQEILDASGRERQSIGRDLHDGLGQELTGVALMLRGLATRIQSRCPDVVDNVNEVVALVNQSIDTARALARGLLPVRAETGGIAAALKALARRDRDLYDLPVTFRDDVASDFALDETNASHLYRIAQEALTNAARHGHATRVDMELSASASAFTLRIADDGTGFPKAHVSTGMGLKIMRYRAGMIGASFEIEANEPHGTVITVMSERPAPGVMQLVPAI
jgi:PAS domain S-box-containing protein